MRLARGAPGGAIEDAMGVGKVFVVAQSHDAQGGGDRAFAGGEDGPDGQDLGVGPDAVGEQWSEGCQEDYHLGWQWHGGRLLGAMTLATSHRSYEATSRFASHLGQSRVKYLCGIHADLDYLKGCDISGFERLAKTEQTMQEHINSLVAAARSSKPVGNSRRR